MSDGELRFTTSADGVRLAYRVRGPQDAPWLVLTNGAGCSEEFWTTTFVPTSARSLRTLWWDYRGHHASGPASDPRRYRVEDHANDLAAVLDAAGVDRAVFVGFSLGVQVTLEAYRRRPEAFRALVLVSGSDEDPLKTFAGTAAFRPLLAAAFGLGPHVPRLASAIARLVLDGRHTVPLAKWSRFSEPDVPDGAFRAYLRKASRLDPVAYTRTLRLMGEHSARGVPREVSVPVLIVAGLEDSMTPAAVMERIRDELREVEYLPVAGGRHTLLMTRGAWVADRVREFLERRGVLSGARTDAT